MTRKKLLMLLGSVCLALVLAIPLVASCAGPAPTPTPEAEKVILIGGGGVGGTFYPLACGIMTIFNDNVPGVRATALATGGSVVNIRMVDTGELLMGMAGGGRDSRAYHGGTETFPDPLKLNHICPMVTYFSMFMTLDPEIKSLYDIKGKRVAMGEPGANTPIRCEIMLKAVGLEKDVDYKGIMLGENEAAEALIDGRADVFFNTATKAGASVVLVTTTKNVSFIPLPEEKMDALEAALKAELNEGLRGTLPKGTYKGLDEDYPTFSTLTSLFTGSWADEDLIYTLVKAMWENIETLGEIHAAGKEFDINDVKMNVGYPKHPGALKYYKEVGVLTEDPYQG